MSDQDEEELFAEYYAVKKQFKKVKKFSSFNENIEKLGGDNGKFSRKLITDSNFETYFEDSARNWKDQDQGKDFESFLTEIQINEIKTYAQLLNKSDVIFNCIVKHISQPTCRSIPALCGMLSAFIRDLKDESHKYIWKSIEILANILDLGNRVVENVEAGYLCFATIIKIQSKFFLKKMKKTFSNLLPLFTSSRSFARKFAAESYAYLLRKSSDFRGLVVFIVQQAMKNPHPYLTDGCSLLFQNVYIGIAGSFHSNCKQLLRDIIHSLILSDSKNKNSEEFVEFSVQLLMQTIGYTIEYSKQSKYNDKLFYQLVITEMLETSTCIKDVTNLLRILQPCLKITDSEEFLNEVNKKKMKKDRENKKNKGKNELKMTEEQKVTFVYCDELKNSLKNIVKLDDFELNDDLINILSIILLSVLNKETYRFFSKELTLKIVEKSKNYHMVIELLLKLVDFESFDLYLMPALGKISSDIVKLKSKDNLLISKLVRFYSYLCTQRRNLKETVNRNTRTNFFDLSNHYGFREWIIANLEKTNRKNFDDENLIDMVVAWPWFYNQSENVKGTEDILDLLKERVLNEKASLLNSQLVFACVSGLYLTQKNVLKNIKMADFENFVRTHNCTDSALLAFELIINVYGVSTDITFFNRVIDLLYPTFLSSVDANRKTALRILSGFKLKLPEITDDHGKKSTRTLTAFEVMYEAENSELTNFRERVLHFRKLRFGEHKEYIPIGSTEKVEKLILLDMVSQFFVSFTPLWKAIHEILETYAHGMNIDSFWEVMLEWIQNVNNHINGTSENLGNGRLIGLDLTNRTDYLSARIQLFEFFETIPSIAERRTRILSPLILNIYRDFSKLTSKTVQMDICLQKNEEELVNEENENENENEEEQIDEQEIIELPSEKKIREEIIHICKALNSLLNVYAKFSSPKSCYLESDLKEMYEKLLSSKYDGLQKAALACIFSYKNQILANYRENLEGLLDEKKMRHYLLYFKLSADEGDVQIVDEHRPIVVPILLRILYSKLMMNSKKKGVYSKRNGIIYVVGGCRSEELTFFLRLYFSQIFEIFGNDISFDKVKNTCLIETFFSKIDLRVFISTLQGISEMVKKIARSMTDKEQKMILDITLVCGIVCKFAAKVEKNSEIVKNLRMSVCDRLTEFFNAFSDREFLKEEIEIIKESIIETSVSHLLKSNVIERPEGKYPVAPFSVVKLIASICKLPSLYNLLLINIDWNTQCNEISGKCDVLDLLLAPLSWPGCFDLMAKTIRGALMKLSELEDEKLITVSQYIKCSTVDRMEGFNFGTAILRTRMKNILDFLSTQIEKEVNDTKRPSSESIILLERFSEHVADFDDIPNRLAKPLIMCVERMKCNTDTMVNMMKSLSRIAPMLKEPHQFFGKFPKLFSKLEGRVLRDGLVDMVEGFVSSKHLEKKTSDLLHLLCELEAWDRSRVNEPHFERRFAAYSALTELWKTEETSIDYVILGMFVATHFHLISTTTDLSLRMTAGNNIRALIDYVGKRLDLTAKKQLLESYLSPTIVYFLKHNIDAVREEALTTFAVLVKAYPENQHLAEINQFSNKDDDLDFLSNMNHIQVHRRQKALKRFVETVESGKKTISFTAINKYLIPMINPYLINHTEKFNALADESLGLVKLAMSKAPWGKYCSYLESWLSKIEKASASPDENFSDKALVRIVVAVIEAFHFNLTCSEEQEAMKNEKYEQNEEKEKKEEKEDEQEEKEKEEEEEGNEQNGNNIILQRIGRVLLPRLTKCLNSKANDVQRTARTSETKATALYLDIKRAPIALAIVKLLQKLPESVASRHLHGVILKICNLLMTQSVDVRESARKTLLQIAKCLGSKYLGSIITEMSLLMTKGFQVHVAIFTTHNLIVSMKEDIKSGDLDSAIPTIVKMCIRDQFYSTEEKENGTIKAECPEAKGNRTPETMQHIGRIVSPSAIQAVLTPLREIINEQPSAKAIQKTSDLLTKFASGLKDNKGMDHCQLLAFIYKSLKADLQKMTDVEKKNDSSEESNNGRRQQSCLILPEAPRRIGALTKVVIRSRDHVFAEFFVILFSMLLKEKKLDISDTTMVARLNSFVPLILDCFDFKYEKLLSCSLRSLCSMIQIKLPAIAANSLRVADTLFILLGDYASTGHIGNKPALLQLNQLIYKGFTNLIITSGWDFLDNEKLTLLLAYAEADVLDQYKQTTMFSLIKTLIKKGVRHERMPEIMEHLSETSIRSPLPNIRSQCRETLLDYIGGASDEKKCVKHHIEFFLDQLDYEYETGRQSAAEMLSSLFKNLLPKSLEEVHILCVVKLGAAIMNDESPKVSAQVKTALKNLLTTIGVSQKQEVFEVICQWLEAENENARTVGIQIASQLSVVEKEGMVSKIEEIFKLVQVFLFDEDIFEHNSENSIICYLNGLETILVNAGAESLKKFNFIKFIESLGDFCKCEESIPIAYAASKLIGQILSLFGDDPSQAISEELAKEVSLWMCRNLRHENLDVSTGEQASKNIVFFSKIIDLEAYQTVLKNIAAACRFEVKRQVKQSIKRTCCFKLAAALFVTGDDAKIQIILETMMPIFVRELRASNDEELNKLTQEVCNLIKRKIGEDDYGKKVAQCQKLATEKNLERKRKIRELAVTAPEDAAELKRKKNKKKTESRKRKIDEMKPYRLMKRRHAEKRKAAENEDF